MRIKIFTYLILFIASYNSLQAQNWIQFGNDIDGENEKEYFGSALSISSDGTTIAIGSPYHDGNGKNSGIVRVFKYYKNNWKQVGQDILGGSKDDFSGLEVSLSSDGLIVAISSYRNRDNGKNSGKVKIFKFNGKNWIQLGNDIEGKSPNDYFGVSISLSSDGSTVTIGATRSFYVKRCGQVRVFKYNGNMWQQVGEDINGDNKNEFFGGEVSLSSDGSIVAVGAYYNDDNGKQSGHVRIYENKSGNWTQMGQNLVGNGAKDFFGWSISLSADGLTVAIGASGEAGFLHSGCICVLKYINGAWEQIGEDIIGEIQGDLFGHSVSLSSDGLTVAAGTRFHYVKVYKNIEQQWLQVGNKINRKLSDNQFGSPISLNHDGSIIVIGAIDSFGKAKKSGQIRVFKLTNE